MRTFRVAASPMSRRSCLSSNPSLRTIFNVDVLTLESDLGGPAAGRVRALSSGLTSGRAVDGPVADSVARIAARGTCADGRLDFLRNVSLDRFLDQTEVSAERRRSVLSGYFAPGSDFREPLICSLLTTGSASRP